MFFQGFCFSFSLRLFHINLKSTPAFFFFFLRELAQTPEKAMVTHSSALAWKIPWWRSLVGCSPWGLEESDMTERLHFHFSLSCIGESNGNPLQYSCLVNPRDGGAWWAAVYGVSQSWTWLTWLTSRGRIRTQYWALQWEGGRRSNQRSIKTEWNLSCISV